MNKKPSIFYNIVLFFLYTILIVLFFLVFFMLTFYSAFIIEILSGLFPECENCAISTFFIIYGVVIFILARPIIKIYRYFKKGGKPVRNKSKVNRKHPKDANTINETRREYVKTTNDALNESQQNIADKTQKARQKTQQQTQQKTRQQKASRQGPNKHAQSPPKKAILTKDPNNVFGLLPTATCEQIKSKYKQLAKKHNPSLGRINRSKEYNERADAIMANINTIYDELKKERGCK